MKNKTFGKTTILNHEEIVSYQTTKKSVLIRIGDTKQEFLKIQNSDMYKEILEFEFHDLEYKVGLPSNTVFFNDEMAIRLHEFFKRNKDCHLVVHCHAGISRSVAIAICYHWFHNTDDEVENMIKSKRFIPNYEVLKHFNKIVKKHDNDILSKRFSIYSDDHFVYNIDDY